MWYSGNLNDDYRLACVKAVHPDSRGLVRTVTVEYHPKIRKPVVL